MDDLPENWEEVVASIKAIYAHPHGGVGGPLHVVLDDFNTETEHVEWCITDMRPGGWSHKNFTAEGAGDLLALAETCAALLLPLTEDERGACISRNWGYF